MFCAGAKQGLKNNKENKKQKVHLRVGVSYIDRKTLSACLFFFFLKSIGSLGTAISFLDSGAEVCCLRCPKSPDPQTTRCFPFLLITSHSNMDDSVKRCLTN